MEFTVATESQLMLSLQTEERVSLMQAALETEKEMSCEQNFKIRLTSCAYGNKIVLMNGD